MDYIADNIITVKNFLCAAGGLIGGWVSMLVGGFTPQLWVLIALMGADFASAWLCAILHHSPKSKLGGLDSRIGWHGLMKKGGILLAVGMCYGLDILAGTDYVRAAAIVGFALNEALSIVENLTAAGVKFPAKIIRILDQIMEKEDAKEPEGE